MSGAVKIKGWCPGALRPMMSGDGLIVRIRPPAGRLDQRQTAGIAALADRFGNGIIDLSNRANVQLRGIAKNRYEALIDGLRSLGLIDPDRVVESRRNILVTPFRSADDASGVIAAQLSSMLARPDAPDVSAKFGYAVDLGAKPVLQDAPGDVRLERAADGTLLLCAAGYFLGKPVSHDTAVPQMLSLARWSLEHGTRMSRILDKGTPLPDGFDIARQSVASVPEPGIYPAGVLVATAFGQLDAATLSDIAGLGALRVTPWRMLLIEGATSLPRRASLICSPADPMLRVMACIGAPGCTQGHAGTRDLARDLAKHVPVGQTLHVSGCAKGCAFPRAANFTMTATSAGFDLIRDGTADATPEHTGLSARDLPDFLKKVH
ncbi:precorrin-3B synthase [Roseovarius aestuarii]|nr:precorrin-3B synthase [Roseovarius aestuarii]